MGKSQKNACDTVDSVINVLQPNAIIFTSVSAANAYKSNKGKYFDDTRIIITPHSASRYWNSPWRNGKKEIEVFEEGLERLYGTT